MKIVNLTPHAITLHGAGSVLTVPPSGTVARLAVTRDARPSIIAEVRLCDIEGATPIGMSIPVHRPTLGPVTNLPAPVAGTIYIASALVAEAVNHPGMVSCARRPDVYSPGELVRDADVIVGAHGLCCYV